MPEIVRSDTRVACIRAVGRRGDTWHRRAGHASGARAR